MGELLAFFTTKSPRHEVFNLSFVPLGLRSEIFYCALWSVSPYFLRRYSQTLITGGLSPVRHPALTPMPQYTYSEIKTRTGDGGKRLLDLIIGRF